MYIPKVCFQLHREPRPAFCSTRNSHAYAAIICSRYDARLQTRSTASIPAATVALLMEVNMQEDRVLHVRFQCTLKIPKWLSFPEPSITACLIIISPFLQVHSQELLLRNYYKGMATHSFFFLLGICKNSKKNSGSTARSLRDTQLCADVSLKYACRHLTTSACISKRHICVHGAGNSLLVLRIFLFLLWLFFRIPTCVPTKWKLVLPFKTDFSVLTRYLVSLSSVCLWFRTPQAGP